MTVSTDALEFVRYLVEQICEKTGNISVDQIEDDRGVLISVRVHEDDMGKLIGKNGQTVSAIRLLVKAMGARNGHKINLKVLEPVA